MKPTEDAKMKNDEAERLIAQITSAVDAVRPAGVLSSNAKLSAALFALYEAAALIRTQAARIAELELSQPLYSRRQLEARAEAAEAALAEAEARAYARAVEDAAIICEALNDKRLSGASGDFIASLASQRIRALAKKEDGV